MKKKMLLSTKTIKVHFVYKTLWIIRLQTIFYILYIASMQEKEKKIISFCWHWQTISSSDKSQIITIDTIITKTLLSFPYFIRKHLYCFFFHRYNRISYLFLFSFFFLFIKLRYIYRERGRDHHNVQVKIYKSVIDFDV